jgi:hypothetical protein
MKTALQVGWLIPSGKVIAGARQVAVRVTRDEDGDESNLLVSLLGPRASIAMRSTAVLTLSLLACFIVLAPAAEELPNDAARTTHLKHLAGAIKGYEIIHDGKPPAKLSDLYRDGLADSLGDFVRPGSAALPSSESEIDAKSDYTMESLPELKDVLVREKNPEPGKDKLLAIAKDGAIKEVSVGKSSVAATSATPAGSPSPAKRVAAATATPAASDLASPGPSAIAASKPSPASSAASSSESLIVPPIDAAAGVGAAARTLTDAGFKPVFAAVKAKSKGDEFKIAGQSPHSGENKPRGSVVTVYVYQTFEEAGASGAAAASISPTSASVAGTSNMPTPAATRQTTPPRLGSFTSPATRSLGSSNSVASAASPAEPNDSQRKIAGTWQGLHHRIQYFADGTFLLDPQLGSNSPRSHWRIADDELITSSPDGNIRVYTISSATERELVLRDDKGAISKLTRISDTHP